MLAKRSVGEANVSVSVLTREWGLLRASARSARKEESKLRYGLEPLTLARFTFVRGRHEWRLTGVERVSHALCAGGAAPTRRCGRISKLLLRLMPGEEGVAQLFDTVREGLGYLARAEDATAESIETVLVLRILARLGYLPDTPELRPFVEMDLSSLDLAHRTQASRRLLVRAINESLLATGL